MPIKLQEWDRRDEGTTIAKRDRLVWQCTSWARRSRLAEYDMAEADALTRNLDRVMILHDILFHLRILTRADAMLPKLNNPRSPFANLRSLFKRVSQLKNSPIVVMLANDLQSDGEASAGKSARHGGRGVSGY